MNINREQAAAENKTRYTDGSTCKNGHTAERYVTTGKCVVCKAEAEKRWYDKNHDKVLEYRNKLRNDPKSRETAKQYAKQYRDDNPELLKQQRKEWYTNNKEWSIEYRATQKGKLVTLLANIKHRANKLGLMFDLTCDDIVIPVLCPVLGIELAFGNKQMSECSPSVDRIDNSKGYTKDNIRVISMRANRLKSDASIEELTAILAYMSDPLRSDRNSQVQIVPIP